MSPNLIIIIGLLLLSTISGMLGLGVAFSAVPFLGLFLPDLVHQVQPLSLLLNGLTALFSTIGFAKSGHVVWKKAIILSVVTTVAAPIGSLLVRFVPQIYIWFIYFGSVAYLAYRLFKPVKPRTAAVAAPGPTRVEFGSVQAGDMSIKGGATALAVEKNPAEAAAMLKTPDVKAGDKMRENAKSFLDENPSENFRLALILAIPISILSGFLGVGPGFLLMPTLIIVGFDPKKAAGINAWAVTPPSFSALIPRLSTAQFDVGLLIPLLVVGAIGSFAGARITSKWVPSVRIKQIFGVLIVVMTLYKILTMIK